MAPQMNAPQMNAPQMNAPQMNAKHLIEVLSQQEEDKARFEEFKAIITELQPTFPHIIGGLGFKKVLPLRRLLDQIEARMVEYYANPFSGVEVDVNNTDMLWAHIEGSKKERAVLEGVLQPRGFRNDRGDNAYQPRMAVILPNGLTSKPYTYLKFYSYREPAVWTQFYYRIV